MPASSLRFGRFELQPHERRLLVDGDPAVLGARAFDLLLALTANPGRLMTKSDLLEEVWPGLVVEEANLSVQVSALRKVLGGDLIATVPGRGYRFTGTPEAVGATSTPTGDRATPVTPPASASPVPASPPTSQARVLIGRDDDLIGLEAALREPGIVTLTGPAGVGKTSLARVLAARSARGALWVDLAPLTHGEQVLPAIARALAVALPGEDPWPTLLRTLAGRVLVVDNCEHLVDAVGNLVTRLLQVAPEQHVLATSQQPLRVDGERERRIEPLALPLDSDALDLRQGAIALFVERAKAADHRFEGSTAQLPLLREICRRLDGIPLALEMAAARVPVLGLSGLRDALVERFALLTAGRRDASTRHRTLAAALDWTHGLLGPDEQRLFRLCSVFSGGFTLELLVQAAGDPAAEPGAADAVTSESRWAVIDTLSHLVDISLVATDGGEPPRFRLLETMRDYARRHLLAAGDEAVQRARHAHALAALVTRAALGDEAARELMVTEHDNLRDAFKWLLANEPARGVEVACNTCGYASFTTWRREALGWLDACEGVVEGGTLPPLVRALWWRERAHQWVMNRDPRARATSKRALELYRGLGDDKGEFQVLGFIVRASIEASDDLEGVCAEMRALIARNPEWPLRSTTTLAGVEAWACALRKDHEGELQHRFTEHELATRDGRYTTADAADTNVVSVLNKLGRHEEALARSDAILARMAGSDSGNAAYAWLGHLSALVSLRRFDAFRAAARRAASIMRKNGVPQITTLYAMVLAEEGRAHDAARMIGFARRAFELCGMALDRTPQGKLGTAERIARLRLDQAAFDDLVKQGRLLDDAAADRLLLANSQDTARTE